MKQLTVLLALVLSTSAFAQDQSVPAPVLRELSKDLAEMQQAVVEAQSDLLAANSGFVAVKAPTTAIHAEPESSSTVMATATAGEPFRVIQQKGAWLEVQTDPHSSGWLSADTVGAIYVPASMGLPSSEELFAKLTAMASKMRDSYRDNPYISVSGFTVEISVPPSVSIDFEFKK